MQQPVVRDSLVATLVTIRLLEARGKRQSRRVTQGIFEILHEEMSKITSRQIEARQESPFGFTQLVNILGPVASYDHDRI
jgi:hypothetical protein